MASRVARSMLVLLLAVGCTAPSPSPTPTTSVIPPIPSRAPTPSPGAWVHFTIQTIWPGDACAGVGYLGAVLHGSPTDPRIAWLQFAKAGRREIVFPLGYIARFAPQLEILNAEGAVVGHEGDAIDGGCVTSTGADLILWP